jgi:hypothetical protein
LPHGVLPLHTTSDSEVDFHWLILRCLDSSAPVSVDIDSLGDYAIWLINMRQDSLGTDNIGLLGTSDKVGCGCLEDSNAGLLPLLYDAG